MAIRCLRVRTRFALLRYTLTPTYPILYLFGTLLLASGRNAPYRLPETPVSL